MKHIFNCSLKIKLIAFSVAVLICSPSAFAQFFQDTWIGYNVGNVTNARFPYGAVMKDFNGDNTLDVAVGLWPWATGFNVMFKNTGGDFSNPVHYNSTLPALDIATADFDKDGKSDIVVPNSGVNWEGNTISMYKNNGSGSFASEQQFSCGTGPVGLVAADFDNDTYVDIAVANYGYIGQGNTVSVLKNNHSGGFLTQTVISAGPTPYKLAAGDLNNDNYTDIVVANEPHKVTVIMNNGSGGFLPGVTYTTNLVHYAGNYYPSVAIADIDKDSKPDVLYSNSKTISGDYAAVVLFHNLGGGVLGNQMPIDLDLNISGPVSLVAADLNNDSWIDVSGATGFNVFCVALNNGSGGFLPSTQYPGGERPFKILSEDINNDNFNDILTLDNVSMEITYHENKGNGTFPLSTTYPTTPISLTLDAADIDLDNDLDIVTSGNGVAAGVYASVLKNNGDGTFQAPANYSVVHGTMFAKFRDLNNDNYPDLLFVQNISYDFCVALNNGDGTFGTITIYPVINCGLRDIDAFDIDKDNDLDVVMCEPLACIGNFDSGKRLFFSKNNGDGTFQPPYSIIIDPNPYYVISGDFNKDGNPDLATANWGTYGANDWIDIIMGNGDGTWQGADAYQVGQGPNGIISGDFNHDSVLDLATCNSGSGGSGAETMSVLLGNSNGTFQNAVTYYGSYSFEFLGTTGITSGDVDHDGDPDIMVSNWGSNDISIYFNDGAGGFDFKYRIGAGWAPEWPFYGDFTGDNVNDIATSVTTPHPGSLDRSVTIIKGVIPVGIEPIVNNKIPGAFRLYQNYPNPFNPVTTIRFDLPEAAFTKLIIYDILGREVKTLVNEKMDAGNHTVWWNGANYSSGLYFFKLVTDKYSETRKMILIK